MKQLNVYLAFPGTCEEALNFYKNCFDGEIVSISRFGESPVEAPEEYKQKIMHAEFKAEGMYLMASDGMPGQPVQPGDMVSLSVDLPDAHEQETIFNRLAEGGKVTMPLEETFWGAVFGMVTDKFGIHWMLSREV